MANDYRKKESTLKLEKLVEYEQVCSEVISGFVYVSSAAVAHDLDSIVSHQITHVVNCAGNTVLNLHSRDGVKYAALPINDDGSREDLACLVYFVFDYIERVWDEGGRVLIHCSRGVSRSCAFCIAFLMWRNVSGLKEAYNYVRGRRPVCQPNTGFTVQLIEWAGRRFPNLTISSNCAHHNFPQRENIFIEDKLVYHMASHVLNGLSMCAPKLCFKPGKRVPLSPNSKLIHPYSVLIIVTTTVAFVWVGNCCHANNESEGVLCADWLRRYDGRPQARVVMQVPVKPRPSVQSRQALCDPTTIASAKQPSDQPFDSKSRADSYSCIALYELSFMGLVDDATLRWERIVDYDHNDLASNSVLWISSRNPRFKSFFWVGATIRETKFGSNQAVSELLREIQPDDDDSNLYQVIWESEETAEFWIAFEAGF